MRGCPSYDCASCCFRRGTSICGFPSGSGDCYQGREVPSAAPSPPCRLPSGLPAGALTRRGVAAPRVRRCRPLLVPPSGPAADLWQARSGSLLLRRWSGCGVLVAQSEQARHPAPSALYLQDFTPACARRTGGAVTFLSPYRSEQVSIRRGTRVAVGSYSPVRRIWRRGVGADPRLGLDRWTSTRTAE